MEKGLIANVEASGMISVPELVAAAQSLTSASAWVAAFRHSRDTQTLADTSRHFAFWWSEDLVLSVLWRQQTRKEAGNPRRPCCQQAVLLPGLVSQSKGLESAHVGHVLLKKQHLNSQLRASLAKYMGKKSPWSEETSLHKISHKK